MIPVKTLEEAGDFCAGMENFVPAPPLKAFGAGGECTDKMCSEAVAEAGSGKRQCEKSNVATNS
uniref:Uncharacterized protein n=1 Tax=Hyaloperonospora arabidopsidis (strain Emoy2) TaxID=559515 RepID=M4B3J5_HYAAE